MKIAFVSNLVEPTGGDRILYHHLTGLQKMGHYVKAYFAGWINAAHQHKEDWNSPDLLKDITIYNPDDIESVDFSDYDMVVVNGLHGARMGMRIKAKKKVWFSQNFDPYVFGASPEIDEVYRHYDNYLTYSHDLGKIIQYYYGRKNIVYCNNGIDYKSFKPFQKKELGKNKRVCFMVAYYRPYKGIKFANEVFGLLKDAGYTTVEINATTGPLENTMEIYQNPSFEDKCKIITGCGTMMHPSVFETWGLVPMESMALGVPVVGVNSKGVMEYAVPGKNALIYDERIPQLIFDAIRALSEKGHDSVYEDIVKEGIKTAKAHDWDVIMPEIEESYMEFLA